MLSLEKLCKAIPLGYDRIEPARKVRNSILEQYATAHYGGVNLEKSGRASPVNLIHRLIRTYLANLAYNNPEFRVTSPIFPYRAYAGQLETAVNHVSREIRLRDSARFVIIDGLTAFGMFKTGICAPELTLQRHGNSSDAGQVYVSRVDPDDAVWDPAARTVEEWMWVGNRFRADRIMLLESGEYDPEIVESLSTSMEGENARKETSGLSEVSARAAAQAAEMYDYVDLCEIYLPSEQIIVTLPWSRSHGITKPLRVVGYEGPEWGPYHLLNFVDVPNNIRGVPLGAVNLDLHQMANRIARRIAQDAENARTVHAYEPIAADDAEVLAEAEHDDWIAVMDIDRIRDVVTAGPTDDAYKVLDWTEREFSEQSGNLNQLAGVKADAPTATQSEMLAAGSAIVVEDDRNQFYNILSRVGQDIAFHLHTNPLVDMRLTKRVAGQEMPIHFTPEMREGDWLDYATRVIPYSTARQDPNLRLRRLMEFLTNGLPGMGAAMQMFGPGFKVDRAVAMLGREMNFEEMDELFDMPAVQEWMVQKLQSAGPPDGKAAGGVGGGMNGARPQQPNPGQMGPSGGIMPGMERRMGQQAMAGELQAAY